MKYCIECGHPLKLKQLREEGMIPFCDHCDAYRFENFNTAISLVVLNPQKDKVLLIQQYGKEKNILVAGYVNKGESAEEAALRELKEETGLSASTLIFQKTNYWQKSNSLIINFIVIADSMNVHSNWEIDKYQWFSLDDALDKISKGGLAEVFYKHFYQQYIVNENAL